MSFSKSLKELLKAHNISQNRLANAIGFSQRAVSKWVNEQAEPTETAIVACAKFFNISIDEMLGAQDEATLFDLSDFALFSEREKELIELYRTSDPQTQIKVFEFIKSSKKTQT